MSNTSNNNDDDDDDAAEYIKIKEDYDVWRWQAPLSYVYSKGSDGSPAMLKSKRENAFKEHDGKNQQNYEKVMEAQRI